MGQAALELSEPIHQPQASPAASADDLLSKLAGDEIDRMLAETESQPAPTIAAVALGSDAVKPGLVETATPNAAVSLTVVETAAASPTALPAANADAAVQEQLDALFNELSGAEPTGDAALPATAAADAAIESAGASMESTPNAEQQQIDAIVAQAGEVAAAEGKLAQTTDSAVGDSLDAQLVQSLGGAAPSAAPPAAKAASVIEAESESHEVKGDPWFLKPLELLNAPFASMNPETRELLGKVAVVTGFNAVVIFLYVLLFRGH